MLILKLMVTLSNSILYKILPSGNVYTFKVFFRALLERPENLQLAVSDDLIFLKKVFVFFQIYIWNVFDN